jgi:O-antigen/teichoic acid export membrane protein
MIIKKYKLIFWTYFVQFLSLIIGVVSTKILTNVLPIDDFGKYSEFLSIISLLLTILSLNLGHGFLRFSSGISQYLKNRYFNTIFVIQTAAVLLFFILAFSTSQYHGFFSKSNVTFFLFIGALSGLFSALLSNYILSSGNFLLLARLNLINTILSFLIIIVGAILYNSFNVLILFWLFANCLTVLLFLFAQKIDINIFRFSPRLGLKLMKFGLPLLIGALAYWFLNSGNRLLISHYLGSETLAKYSVMMTVPSTITIIYATFNTMFLSHLSKLHNNSNFLEVEIWLSRVYTLYIIISLAFASAFSVLAIDYVIFLSSQKYLYTNLNISVFLGGIQSVFFGAFMILQKMYDMTLTPIKSMLNSLIMCLVAFSLNVILIPKYGILGSQIGNVFGILIGILIIRFSSFSNLNPNLGNFRVLILLSLTFLIFFIIHKLNIQGIYYHIFLSFFVFMIHIGIGIFIFKINLREFFK